MRINGKASHGMNPSPRAASSKAKTGTAGLTLPRREKSHRIIACKQCNIGGRPTPKRSQGFCVACAVGGRERDCLQGRVSLGPRASEGSVWLGSQSQAAHATSHHSAAAATWCGSLHIKLLSSPVEYWRGHSLSSLLFCGHHCSYHILSLTLSVP